MFKLDFFKTDTDTKINKLETELQKLETALVNASELKESKEHDVNELHKLSITDGVDNDKSIGKLQLEIMQLESKVKAIQGLIDSSIARLEAIETEKRQERHEDYDRSIQGLQMLQKQWQEEIETALIPILAKWGAMTGRDPLDFRIIEIAKRFGGCDYDSTIPYRNIIRAEIKKVASEQGFLYSLESEINSLENQKKSLADDNFKYRRVA